MNRGEKIEKGKMFIKYELETVRLFLKGITVEDALDSLAAVILIAFVFLAFFLEGLLDAIPEDLTVMYTLMGIYLAIYVFHKFRNME